MFGFGKTKIIDRTDYDLRGRRFDLTGRRFTNQVSRPKAVRNVRNDSDK